MNFLPSQYDADKNLAIRHNYLFEQFENSEEIIRGIIEVVRRGDFTLGEEVDILEEEFAAIQEAKYAVAVGSGTDAIRLSLRIAGVGYGDEVITSPFTFFATIGAIVDIGAVPVFVDALPDGNIDTSQIISAITQKTKAIVPIHWSGRPVNFDEIKKISEKFGLVVVEDACHATLARYKGMATGTLGDLGAFSFHPLKNINIWGDGGIITTNNPEFAERLKIIRSHGLINRNICLFYGVNSRLDTIQAVVARYMLRKLKYITTSRQQNAAYLDKYLSKIKEIELVQRSVDLVEVFHLYWIKCEKRDELVHFLRGKGIDAKIHYPNPMHLQPAFVQFVRGENHFPVAEELARTTLSLPVHEYVTQSQLDFIIESVREFFHE